MEQDVEQGEIRVIPVPGIPEVDEGGDLAVLIGAALASSGITLEDGDVLVVTSKIVSKAEGRRVAAADREDAITAETVRVVATRPYPGGVTRIVENRQGIVQAAAGVDASNTPDGTVLLLPVDPDASARALAASLRASTGARIGVVITDTLGRAWREGQIDLAIGAAGVRVFDDLHGSRDTFGRELLVTKTVLADELASAGDLVKGKTTGVPVAVVRGFDRGVVDDLDTPARAISRTGERDMFRLGTDEAILLGRSEERAVPAFRSLALRGLRTPDLVDVVVLPLPPGTSHSASEWVDAAFDRRPPRWARGLAGIAPFDAARSRVAEARDLLADELGSEVLLVADTPAVEARLALAVDAEAGLVRVTTALRMRTAEGRAPGPVTRLLHPVAIRTLLARATRTLARSRD
ncbi:coenzyme F420-0:L-glutamate ligase [Cnuibacter physcomitrellae]|uniref:coenzyme F420-0:L-glutamate ligase n=1 Tax=Cnuibacter physcomitrellae TaxID=1619308 RepID=UPI0028781167|nr:coenzyme F420-0:L-glutamate ligase [Cnuibacter physcomitrellae]